MNKTLLAALFAVACAQENKTLAGTCTDAADQAAWTGGGKAKFTDDMTTCGKKCFGAKSCVSTCLQSAEKYSAGCADCFGGLASCTEDNCLAPCLKTPPTKACADCQNSKCIPAFVTCSGIPESDLPPPPSMVMLNATTPACADAADTKIWEDKGKAAFGDDMSKCGKQCMGANACVAKCVESQEGYSDACAACFGSLGECTTKNCLMQCINGNSPACTTCQEAHCATPFHDCSGLSPP